jgi:hypothetical protein
MGLRRFEKVAAASAVVLAGCVVAGLAGFGSAGIENTTAALIVDRPPTISHCRRRGRGRPAADGAGQYCYRWSRCGDARRSGDCHQHHGGRPR